MWVFYYLVTVCRCFLGLLNSTMQRLNYSQALSVQTWYIDCNWKCRYNNVSNSLFSWAEPQVVLPASWRILVKWNSAKKNKVWRAVSYVQLITVWKPLNRCEIGNSIEYWSIGPLCMQKVMQPVQISCVYAHIACMLYYVIYEARKTLVDHIFSNSLQIRQVRTKKITTVEGGLDTRS